MAALGRTLVRMAHRFAESFFRWTQAELDGERAATLARATRKLEAARERYAALSAQLAEDSSEALRRAWRAARDEAEHRRWALCVQREAVGLYDHRWVDRIYPPLPAA